MKTSADLPQTFQNASEEHAYQAVKATFGQQFPEHQLLTNVILRTGEMGGPETSEYDLILVCSAGVIVFEVKGWSKAVLTSQKAADGQHDWVLHKLGGEQIQVRDPVAQGGFKVRYLLEHLKGIFCTQYVLFTEPSLTLDQGCNAHAIQLSDLPYLSRITRATARKYREQHLLDKEKVSAVAAALLEASHPHTSAQHLRNVLAWADQKAAVAAQGERADPTQPSSGASQSQDGATL